MMPISTQFNFFLTELHSELGLMMLRVVYLISAQPHKSTNSLIPKFLEE